MSWFDAPLPIKNNDGCEKCHYLYIPTMADTWDGWGCSHPSNRKNSSWDWLRGNMHCELKKDPQQRNKNCQCKDFTSKLEITNEKH